MDPRYTTIARTPIGLALRCEKCMTEIDDRKVPPEGVSLFELVRSSLRHGCEDAPADLTDEEMKQIDEIVKHLEEVPNAVEGD